MTVIAWDGVTLAADKLADSGGNIRTVTKIWRAPDGALLAGAGDFPVCLALRDWYTSGGQVAAFPKLPDALSGDLWVVQRVGTRSQYRVLKYEGVPHPIEFEDRTFAAGCGRDYAIGAMAMGADARQAVEITCKHETSCGNGIDTLELA